MKMSQPTSIQHTLLQSPQVITLGLHYFLWNGNGSETAYDETKGNLSLNQWALDLAQHLFGFLYTQQSKFILYPFLGLSLQQCPYFFYWCLSLATLSITLRKRPFAPLWHLILYHGTAMSAAPTPYHFHNITTLFFLLVQVSKPFLQASKLFLLFPHQELNCLNFLLYCSLSQKSV